MAAAHSATVALAGVVVDAHADSVLAVAFTPPRGAESVAHVANESSAGRRRGKAAQRTVGLSADDKTRVDLLWSASADGRVKQWAIEQQVAAVDDDQDETTKRMETVRVEHVATKWGHQLAVTGVVALPPPTQANIDVDVDDDDVVPDADQTSNGLKDAIRREFGGARAITTSLDCTVRGWVHSNSKDDLTSSLSFVAQEQDPLRVDSVACVEVGPSEAVALCTFAPSVSPKKPNASGKSNGDTTSTSFGDVNAIIGGLLGKVGVIDFESWSKFTDKTQVSQQDPSKGPSSSVAGTDSKNKFAAMLGIAQPNDDDEDDDDEDGDEEEGDGKKRGKKTAVGNDNKKRRVTDNGSQAEETEKLLARAKRVITQLGGEKVITCVDYSSRLGAIAIGTQSGRVHFVSLTNDKSSSVDESNTGHSIKTHSSSIRAVKFAPNVTAPGTKKKGALADAVVATCSYDGELRLIDVSDGIESPRVLANGVAHSGWVMSLDWHPTANYIVTGSTDGTIALFKLDWDQLLSPVSPASPYHLKLVQQISCIVPTTNTSLTKTNAAMNDRFTTTELQRKMKEAGLVKGPNALQISPTVWSVKFNPAGDLIAASTDASNILLFKCNV